MKISGQLLSTKPVSLLRAMKLISRFAVVDNGSSPIISLYLERAAEAFNHFVQFHNKRSQDSDVGNNPGRKSGQKLQTDLLEEKPDGEKVRALGSGGKSGRKAIDGVETNRLGHEAIALESGGRAGEGGEEEKEEEKKKKKRESDAIDLEEKRSTKKRRAEGLDS